MSRNVIEGQGNKLLASVVPRVRSNICLNAHPAGCKREVQRQVEYVRSKGPIGGTKAALVIGSSMGYGLASRITAAFGCGASTVGVMYEREPNGDQASAGWYTNQAFEEEARKSGIPFATINGDAFSDAIKVKTIEELRRLGLKVDLIVYSLASPARTDPKTGQLYRSVLKPIGSAYTSSVIDIMTGEIREQGFEIATSEEIEATTKVMGGEDWKLWIEALLEADLVEKDALTVAYSYIGPEMTFPIYRSGTIGKAKEHLEHSAREIGDLLGPLSGRAFVSVNKALVTRASSVIPGVSLYLMILYKLMKERGTHEGCIEQIRRLFSERLYSGATIALDSEGRLRLDDWEMEAGLQAEIAGIWPRINEGNLAQFGDLEGVRKEFLNIHGFAVDGVEY